MVELIIAHAYSAEKNANCAEGSGCFWRCLAGLASAVCMMTTTSRHLCPPQVYKNSWLYTQNSRWFRVQGIAIFIWNTQRKSETRMMYLMFHHVTVLTRNGLDHGSPTNRLSSGSCLGDPSLANRPLLILKKLSPLSHYYRDSAVVFSP